MYLIEKDGKTLERTTALRYARAGAGGAVQAGNARRFDFYVVPESGRQYRKDEVSVRWEDDALPEIQMLGRAQTDLQLEQIGQGQFMTELQLKMMEANEDA